MQSKFQSKHGTLKVFRGSGDTQTKEHRSSTKRKIYIITLKGQIFVMAKELFTILLELTDEREVCARDWGKTAMI